MKRSASELELEDTAATKRRKIEEEESKIGPDAQIPQLPKETWLHVIAGRNIMLINSIDNMNIWNFREVSKYFKELIDESAELSWAKLYFRHYGGITCQIRNCSKTWKQIYLEARSALEKVINEDKYLRLLEVPTDLLKYNEEITIKKAEEDHGALWKVIEECYEEESFKKLGEHIQQNKHCSMASYYLGNSMSAIHMEVIYLLFEEKYYKAWKQYLKKNNFYDMPIDGLFLEYYLGWEEKGYRFDLMMGVLDMGDVDLTIQQYFNVYWHMHEESLLAEIERLGHHELLARIEKIVVKQ